MKSPSVRVRTHGAHLYYDTFPSVGDSTSAPDVLVLTAPLAAAPPDVQG
jgi:hypothetical protein